MPDFGDEAHLRRLERVLRRDFDVNLEVSTFIWGIRGAFEVTHDMSEVVDVGRPLRRGDGDATVCILDHVLDLLLETTVSIGDGSHDWWCDGSNHEEVDYRWSRLCLSEAQAFVGLQLNLGIRGVYATLLSI